MPALNRAVRLDRSLQGWIYNFARRNYWRVAAWYELSDLVQDGLVCYVICREKYSDVKSKRHFMSLLKRTFQNHITDLANARTQAQEMYFRDLAKEFSTEAPANDQDIMDRLIGYEHELGTLMIMVRQAPLEVLAVLRLLFTDAGLQKLKEAYLRNDGVRESTNQYLCRLLNYDPELIDLPSMVRDYLIA